MTDGISPNPLNDISKKYLEIVSQIHKEDEGRAVSNWDTTSKESVNPDLVLKVAEEVEEVDEDAKMGRQSDGDLAAAHKKFSNMDQSSPANRHMLKRISKELNRRKTVKEENALEKRAKENEKARKWLKKDAKDSGYTDIALKASMSKGAGVKESLVDNAKAAKQKRKSKKTLRDIALSNLGASNESFSSWRDDLREIVSEPESEAEKEVKEKKVKNKVLINPKLGEAIQEIGGQLLEVVETQEDPGLKSKEQRQKMLKKQVLMKKLQAVRSGGGADITASHEPEGEMVEGAVETIKKVTKAGVKRHKKAVEDKKVKNRKAVPYAALAAEYDPLEDAIEYFYEEGINEEGFDQLIEEIGLDEFVNFVEDFEFLTEEEGRPARKASVRAKSYEKVKAEVDKSDAAKKAAKKGEYAPSYAKKETDVTVYDDDKPAAKKKAVAKKPVAKKAAAKPVAKKRAPKPVAVKKPVTKKVVKAVAKVKKTQPAKKPSKQGLGDKIRSAYKRGVERHKKARAAGRVPEKRAKEFASGVKSGVKSAVKFAKDVKKVVSEEELAEKVKGQDTEMRKAASAERRSGETKKLSPSKGRANVGKMTRDIRFYDKLTKRKKHTPGTVNESRDKALDLVRASIIKKHGEGAIYDAKRDKPTEAQKKKNAADRKAMQDKKNKDFASRAKKAGYKSTQDYANVVARYGSEDNMKKGKGLGT